MKNSKEYKKILNITGNYTLEGLKKAYYRVVKENHPDKFKNPLNKKIANDKMKLIIEAYEYLKFNVDNQTNTAKEQKKQTEKQDNKDVISSINLCIKSKRIINIKYRSNNGSIRYSSVLPIEIIYDSRTNIPKYLKAFNYIQNKHQNFRIKQILETHIFEFNDFNDMDYQYDTYSYKNENIFSLQILLPICTAALLIASFFEISPDLQNIFIILANLLLLGLILFLRKYLPAIIMVAFFIGLIIYLPPDIINFIKNQWIYINTGLLVVIGWLLMGYLKNE